MNDAEMLAALLAEKTPEELEELKRKAAVKKLSALLHTLLCPNDHEKGCDFYVEETTTLRSTARPEWEARTGRMLEKAGTGGIEDLEEILQHLPLFVGTKGTKRAFLSFLKLLLPSLITRAIEGQASPPGGTFSSQCGPSKIAGFLEE